MKILAIVDVAPGADLQKVRQGLVDELRVSWRLYTEDVLREAYATAAPSRVVFVLEASSAVEAERQMAGMPLVVAGLLKIEFIELRPFANWSLLFGASG
jgi:hypothetical protein